MDWTVVGAFLLGAGLCSLGYLIGGFVGWGSGLAIAIAIIIFFQDLKEQTKGSAA